MTFLVNPKDYEKTLENRAKLARELADQLTSGKRLRKEHKGFIAIVLNQWADIAPKLWKRTRGQAPRIDPMEVSRHYEALVRWHGFGKVLAREKVAEHYGVSVEAVRAALKKYGAAAAAYFDFIENPKLKK